MGVYNQISYYKAYRSRLLSTYYKEEFSSVGRVVFKNPPFEGIVLKLWKDVIYIEYHRSINKVFTKDIKSRVRAFEKRLFNSVQCEISDKWICITPIKRNDFSDTIEGMKLRAEHYVFIAILSLDCFKN